MPELPPKDRLKDIEAARSKAHLGAAKEKPNAKRMKEIPLTQGKVAIVDDAAATRHFLIFFTGSYAGRRHSCRVADYFISRAVAMRGQTCGATKAVPRSRLMVACAIVQFGPQT